MNNIEKVDTFNQWIRYTYKEKDQFGHKFVILVPNEDSCSKVVICPNFCVTWLLSHESDVERIKRASTYKKKIPRKLRNKKIFSRFEKLQLYEYPEDVEFKYQMEEIINWEIDAYNKCPLGTHSYMLFREGQVGCDVHGVPIYVKPKDEDEKVSVEKFYNFIKMLNDKYYYGYHSLEPDYNWYYNYYEE